MQSYTFASDDAMAAVLAAFDASGDDTYAITARCYGEDFRALVVAVSTAVSCDPARRDVGLTLLRGMAEAAGYAPADALILVSERNTGAVAHAVLERAVWFAGTYVGAWDREQFDYVTASLRWMVDNASEGDSDGSVFDNAGSLLSRIAETLGIEFI